MPANYNLCIKLMGHNTVQSGLSFKILRNIQCWFLILLLETTDSMQMNHLSPMVSSWENHQYAENSEPLFYRDCGHLLLKLVVNQELMLCCGNASIDKLSWILLFGKLSNWFTNSSSDYRHNIETLAYKTAFCTKMKHK